MTEHKVWSIETTETGLYGESGADLHVQMADLHRAFMHKYGSDRARRRDGEDGRPEVWLQFESRPEAEEAKDDVGSLLESHSCNFCRIIAFHREVEG